MQTTTSQISKKDIFLSWGVHLFTASGIFFALLSIEALYAGRTEAAINWLYVTLLIDGLDGPLARALNVKKACPQMDGSILDLVVDYVTYVLIPALFMLNLDMFPQSVELVATGLILIVGALYFGRTDMKTFDNWFVGFPGTWNFLAISLWLVGTSELVNLLVVILFVALSASKVKFFHFIRTQQLRLLTLSISTIYFAAIIYMVNIDGQLENSVARLIIWVWFTYTFAMSIWRTWIFDEPKAQIS